MVPTAQTNLFCHRQTDITKHGQCTLNQKVIDSPLCIVLVYFLLIFRGGSRRRVQGGVEVEQETSVTPS